LLIRWNTAMEHVETSDSLLIDRIVRGDYDAFERVVEKYEGKIFRHLRKMVNDDSSAEDLLQDTFLNAFKGLKSFSGEASLSTWLFKIATNNALMVLRKRKLEEVPLNEESYVDPDYPFMSASPEFANSPLELLLSMEGRSRIEDAISKLPAIHRSVILLKDVEGFSIRETAAILNVSTQALKSRLHRARTAIRERLERYYSERAPGQRRVG
jgi:RNA polymerase sigma-70 factor, ECF subfamily